MPPGFKQIFRINNDEHTPSDEQELYSSDDLELYVYPFAKTEVATIPVLPREMNDNFGLFLKNDELAGRVYVSGIEKDSTNICKAFSNKPSRFQFKGSYITAINNDPVFNSDEATEKLKKILDHHLGQNWVEITFASEEKRSGMNLKRAIDNYYDYARATIKKIKSSEFTKDREELKEVDGDPDKPQYKYITKILKVFNKVECKGLVIMLYKVNPTTTMIHTISTIGYVRTVTTSIK